MVKVYRFTKYNIISDGNEKSRRWATREAIKRVGGEIIEYSEIEVDDSAFAGSEIDGMTPRNFDPHPRTGVQTQVYGGPRAI